MDNIFHLAYCLCFYERNQLNYNQISEGSINSKKTFVAKVLKKLLGSSNPKYIQSYNFIIGRTETHILKGV